MRRDQRLDTIALPVDGAAGDGFEFRPNLGLLVLLVFVVSESHITENVRYAPIYKLLY